MRERGTTRGAQNSPHKADTLRPAPRTDRTRRVPHPVLTGHAASRTPYSPDKMRRYRVARIFKGVSLNIDLLSLTESAPQQ